MSALAPWELPPPDASTVPEFVPGPGVSRLDVEVDLDRLRRSLDEALERLDYDTTYGEWGFGVLPVTRRPGTEGRDVVEGAARLILVVRSPEPAELTVAGAVRALEAGETWVTWVEDAPRMAYPVSLSPPLWPPLTGWCP